MSREPDIFRAGPSIITFNEDGTVCIDPYKVKPTAAFNQIVRRLKEGGWAQYRGIARVELRGRDGVKYDSFTAERLS